MKNIKRALLLTAMGAALCLPQAYADVITQWNFNGPSAASVPGGESTPLPSLGSGSASLLGGTVGSFASGVSNGGSSDTTAGSPPNYGWGTTAYPVIGAASETAGVQFMVSTVGYNNISLNYDQRASNTSSRFWAVYYTTDGNAWNRLTLDNSNATANTPFGATGTFISNSGDTWFNGRTINLTGIAGANNNANFGIRIVSSFDGGSGYLAANGTSTYAATGTARFDMVTFNGSVLGARNLTWNLTTDGTWNSSTTNWTTGVGTTAYASGDNATFDKTQGGTIAIIGTLTPASVTVSATSGTYTFDTLSTVGKISGLASLTKSNNGTLVISGDNDFSGGTSIVGGTIQIDSNTPLTAGTPLGSGAIALNGGTLQSTASFAPASISNTVTVGNSGGTINTGTQDLTIAGMPNLSGMLTKTGTSNLLVTGNFNPGSGGGLNISAGNVVLNQPGFVDANNTGTIVNLAGNSSLTGNLILSNPIRFNVNSSAIVSGTGEIRVLQSNTLVSQASGNVGGTIAAPIKLNANNTVSGDVGTWSGTTYTPSNFLFTIGGTSSGGLTLNAPISGNAEVDFSNNRLDGGGTGYLQLNAVNTYTGNTTINANTPGLTAYSVRLGVNNALPATGLIAGTKTGLGSAVLDLNGFNQHLGYLADGGNTDPLLMKSLKITNEGDGRFDIDSRRNRHAW